MLGFAHWLSGQWWCAVIPIVFFVGLIVLTYCLAVRSPFREDYD
jgi:hypothetical protein